MKIKMSFLAKASILLLAVLLSSCVIDEPQSFDPALLIGRWEQNGLFEIYNQGGTGVTWDENDDVSEEEAQSFEWTFESGTLMKIHIMEQGADVPKSYTVTTLDSYALEYEDEFGKQYNFVRVR